MIGKYKDDHNFVLPKDCTISESKYQSKINRFNNSAYIDGYFSYLSSLIKKRVY